MNRTIRRACVIAAVSVVLFATPAFAVTGPDASDGAEPLAFVAVIVAGVALVGAVAALIMGRKRPPA